MDVKVGLSRRLNTKELILSKCGAGENSWESLGLQGDQTSQSKRKINSKYSLERLVLKLKFQYFGHLMWRADSLEKTLMLRKIEDKRRRGRQRMRWLDDITDSMDMNLSKFWEMVKERKAWHATVHGVANSWTLFSSWTTAKEADHRGYRGGKREKPSLAVKFQKLETLIFRTAVSCPWYYTVFLSISP